MKKLEWLSEFAGSEKNTKFYTILAPAMFQGGGYGASYENDDGLFEFYQVIRTSDTTDEPYFSTGTNFKRITLHE
ncbi:hypothetical protein [Natronospora cellulosivora (SeqCode)]